MEKLLSYELLTHKGSPFELQDVVIKGTPCKIFPRGPQTLRDVFIKSAAFADREFIIKGDMRLTYRQAFRRTIYFARNMRQKYKIKKGSRVALIMDTGPEWAIVFMALCFAGAAPVIIPVDVKESDIIKALELTNCELVAADFSSLGKINVSGIKLPVVIPMMRQTDAISRIACGTSAVFSIFNLADTPGDQDDAYIEETCETTPDDEALISFTSGTTGTPKGVVFNHRNMTTGLMNMMLGGLRMSFCAATDGRKHRHDAQTCSLLLSPFSHASGYSQLMLMCYLGGKIVLLPEWDLQTATDLIDYERVRSLCGLSPTMANELLYANRSRDSLRSLSHMNIYGVPLRKKFIRALTNVFPHISLGTGYGMTETCGAISVVSGKELLDNPELSGLALPSVNIKIVDHDGCEATQGNHGEIWVRGAMVMQGYCFGREDSGAILEDGWLKTGDLGYIGPAGNLYVTGRLDAFRCGDRPISSEKLERLVCELDTVDDAAALRISGSRRQGVGIALAVIPNSTVPVDKIELTREVAACVKAYADDVQVVIMNDIPRTASGKADRKALELKITDFMNSRISGSEYASAR